jgi:hypothetical protein
MKTQEDTPGRTGGYISPSLPPCCFNKILFT